MEYFSMEYFLIEYFLIKYFPIEYFSAYKHQDKLNILQKCDFPWFAFLRTFSAIYFLLRNICVVQTG